MLVCHGPKQILVGFEIVRFIMMNFTIGYTYKYRMAICVGFTVLGVRDATRSRYNVTSIQDTYPCWYKGVYLRSYHPRLFLPTITLFLPDINRKRKNVLQILFTSFYRSRDSKTTRNFIPHGSKILLIMQKS